MLSVTNHGPSGANAPSVTDTLPDGVDLRLGRGHGWSCANTGDVSVTCTRPVLAGGGRRARHHRRGDGSGERLVDPQHGAGVVADQRPHPGQRRRLLADHRRGRGRRRDGGHRGAVLGVAPTGARAGAHRRARSSRRAPGRSAYGTAGTCVAAASERGGSFGFQRRGRIRSASAAQSWTSRSPARASRGSPRSWRTRSMRRGASAVRGQPGGRRGRSPRRASPSTHGDPARG